MNDLGQELLEPVRYRSRAMSSAPTTVSVLTAAFAVWWSTCRRTPWSGFRLIPTGGSRLMSAQGLWETRLLN